MIAAPPEAASAPEPTRLDAAGHGRHAAGEKSVFIDSAFSRIARVVATTGGGVIAGLAFGPLGGVTGGILGLCLFALAERQQR